MTTLHERLQHYGSETLSASEPIDEQMALLFQTGGALDELMRTDLGEFAHTYHLGMTKAIQLQAVFEVAKRVATYTAEQKYQIKSADDAARLVMAEMMFLDHEQLRVLSLDTKNQVVANQVLYTGTVNASCLRVAEIFRTAITRKCRSIIVVHNHPSGVITASEEDIEVTKQLVEAGNLLEIEVLDHLIIGNQRYLSLKERMRW
jgi:DNA repair protein RadC